MRLPKRVGPTPRTSTGLPHQQLDQQPSDAAIVEELAERVFDLPRVSEAPSQISVPGARALVLESDAARGPSDAFLVGREFAHLHPSPDHSLHMALPPEEADAAVASGWAERHPMAGHDGFGAGLVMVFAPRDAQEARVVEDLVRCSRDFAAGTSARPELQG